MNNKNSFMLRAIELSIESVDNNGGPFGCVIVKNNKIIAEGNNQVTNLNDPTAHAEIQVIRKAGKKEKNYRLVGTTLYVTLEPCIMCLGALMHARIERIVFGAKDTKNGVCGSLVDLTNASQFNHHTFVTSGVLEKQCQEILRSFFKLRR